jgi:hypothetical protein
MLNHYELTGFTIDHEQAVMILRYAAELEETGK